MKGISYITDENNHKKALVIDLEEIAFLEDEKELDGFIKIGSFINKLIAEYREEDKEKCWEKVLSNKKESTTKGNHLL